MPFISPYNNVKVQLLNDRAKYPFLTLEVLVYEYPPTGECFEVKKYFRTDGASVPKLLVATPIIGPAIFQQFFGQGVWQGFQEGVLHDWLRTPVNGVYPVEAAKAHEIFKYALEERGYSEALVTAYYNAVKLFNS